MPPRREKLKTELAVLLSPVPTAFVMTTWPPLDMTELKSSMVLMSGLRRAIPEYALTPTNLDVMIPSMIVAATPTTEVKIIAMAIAMNTLEMRSFPFRVLSLLVSGMDQ